MISLSLSLSLSLILSFALLFAHSDEETGMFASVEKCSVENPKLQGVEGSLQLTSHEKLRTQSNNHNELKSSHNNISELRNWIPQLSLHMRLHPHQHLDCSL